jgi:hypothetical protein
VPTNGRSASRHKLADGDNLVDPNMVMTRVYYIGKVVLPKDSISCSNWRITKQCTNKYFAIDIYGSGPDQKRYHQGLSWSSKVGEEATGGTTGNANGSSE